MPAGSNSCGDYQPTDPDPGVGRPPGRGQRAVLRPPQSRPTLLLVDPEGVGTIVNDDGTPGALAWLEWSPVAPVHYAGEPLAATLTARDVDGNTVTASVVR